MLYDILDPDYTPNMRRDVQFMCLKKRSFRLQRIIKGTSKDIVCVLNFASATNPGGGVKNGSAAQEESLCRCSTLYPTLKTRVLWDSFYSYHRQAESVLYSDACIYTPDIIVFKTDTEEPEMMEEKDWFKTDVITCAAQTCVHIIN